MKRFEVTLKVEVQVDHDDEGGWWASADGIIGDTAILGSSAADALQGWIHEINTNDAPMRVLSVSVKEDEHGDNN